MTEQEWVDYDPETVVDMVQDDGVHATVLYLLDVGTEQGENDGWRYEGMKEAVERACRKAENNEDH